MLTGLNTDVAYRELVLHVQTEDKGSGDPCIESLVYVGGRILERRREGYRRLIEEGLGTDAVLEKMESQHRSLIQQIRQGGFDQRLVELGALAAQSAAEAAAGTGALPRGAAPSAETASAPAGTAPSLDQVILDYLNAEAEQEQLVLVMDARGELHPGSHAELSFQARTSLSDEPVVGAAIVVRMISTSAEPVELGGGDTDSRGRLRLRVSLPPLAGGAAALIVRASSPVGSAEIKHLI